MTQEPILQDKIHLLMEETGCEPWEAELAITSADYNVEKAVRTIGTLLRNIVVVRGKFLLAEKNLYGLAILIVDRKKKILLRVRAVVSYNPALYETPLALDWYEFEKTLYVFRLLEGSLQQITQDLERALVERLGGDSRSALFDGFRDADSQGWRAIVHALIADFFPASGLEIALTREELNLDQFRRLESPRGEPAASASRTESGPETTQGGNVVLQVEVSEDAQGTAALLVQPGDSVSVLVTDDRDIARYLAKLMGGQHEGEAQVLTAPVEEVRREGGIVRLQVRLSSGILGLAAVSEDRLLAIQRRPSEPFWKRLWSPL